MNEEEEAKQAKEEKEVKKREERGEGKQKGKENEKEKVTLRSQKNSAISLIIETDIQRK